MGQVALAQFQNRNLDTAAQLFVTQDTEGFLSQISTVEKVNENQNSVLQDYQQEQASLADLEHSAQTDLAALGEQEKQLKELRASSDAKLAESKAVLAKLTADRAAADLAAEEQKKADAQALAERSCQRPDFDRHRRLRSGHRDRPRRQGPRLRPRTARQALPVRRNRPERVRLLRSDRCRMAAAGVSSAADVAVPVP